MAKVFRLNKGNGQENVDWFSSTEINSNFIEGIAAEGENGKKLPTSIPSPFARIDLVRTAFKTVGGDNDVNLDGTEKDGKAIAIDNQKLISDALDIGQILFNYDKNKENLQLVAWDKDESLQKLLNGNASQKHLGNTLKLFLKQDAIKLDDGSTPYNFDKFKKIYILIYKHKIIGGTSPRTLFFAAPDASKTDICFGTDTMLDNSFLPLYKRDNEYVKYLYSISKTTPNFNRDFPEFNQYIKKTLEKLDKNGSPLYGELMDMDYSVYLKSLKDVFLDDNSGTPLHIITGIPQKQYIKPPEQIEKISDFVIKPSKGDIKLKPLVLPVHKFEGDYVYTEGKWNSTTIVPAEDERTLDNRTLPAQGDLYPYLTMNDFLTDSIIKLPYKVNSNKFLAFSNKGCEQFLLPIKKAFFKYFSEDDLLLNKNRITALELVGGSVEVEISIPIKRGFISYKKIYHSKGNINNKRDPKQGTILEKSFALSVYPFVASTETDITYSVGVADVTPLQSEKIDISFYSKSDFKKIVETDTHRKKRASEHIETHQSVVDKQFGAIELKVGNVENIIIPKWREYKGGSGDDYQFTIDFGTTNSHIEYRIGKSSEKAYDITEGEEQIVFLTPKDVDDTDLSIGDIIEAEEYITQEVISKRFGKGELRKAPFRTCLVQNKDINYDKRIEVFSDLNIAFDYEKLAIKKHLKTRTDLKWSISQDSEGKERVSFFIEELLMLCKNKVLMNNGNLSKTKIIWFYPVSMTNSQKYTLENIWKDKFKKVFNISGEDWKKYKNNIPSYPESIAPFYYYFKKEGIKTHVKPSVSIDIGGGTSDVMIYANEKPEIITSFVFAGNAIFGDGFNGNISKNGFVQKYSSTIRDILKNSQLREEENILDSVLDDNSSADVVNFFFSLNSNKKIESGKIPLDFAKMLAGDSDFKILFLLFYSSIVYHIAQMMKAKGMETPRNILFSGTGSKTLNIIDSDEDHSSITKLFNGIFNEVYKVDDSDIEMKNDPNPKELTCKGGFYIGNELNIDHTEITMVAPGKFDDNNVQLRSGDKRKLIKYEDVNKDFISKVIANVENFYKIFFELSNSINFIDEFNVSQKSLDILDEIKSKDLEDFIMSGIKAQGSGDILSETLFFYPFKGKLNELATEINDKK